MENDPIFKNTKFFLIHSHEDSWNRDYYTNNIIDKKSDCVITRLNVLREVKNAFQRVETEGYERVVSVKNTDME